MLNEVCNGLLRSVGCLLCKHCYTCDYSVPYVNDEIHVGIDRIDQSID